MEYQSFSTQEEYLPYASYWAQQYPGRVPIVTTYALGAKTTWTGYWRNDHYLTLHVWMDDPLPPDPPPTTAWSWGSESITDRLAFRSDGRIAERSGYFGEDLKEWHRGKVSIVWDDHWPWPADPEEKARAQKAWLSRYLVLTQTTTYSGSGGPPATVVDHVKSLADVILEAGATSAQTDDRSITADPGDPRQYPSGQSKATEVYLVRAEMTWEPIRETWGNVDDNQSPVDFEYTHNVPPPDGRWLPGRGRRVFPDKKKPGDILRNRLALKIHTAPHHLTAGKKIYLKTFDVDDATDETFDKQDGQPVIDDNGRKGNDNKDQDNARLKTGQFFVGGQPKGAATEVTLEPDGNKNVIFETTMQPGDNFRAALALKQEDLAATKLQVDNPDGTGFLDGKSDQQPAGFNGVVSPLLTVWRKLHIEEDTMAQVDTQGAEKNFESGVINSVSPGASGAFTLNLSIQLPGGKNRFQNGKIFIGGWRYDVISSDHSWGFDDDVVVQDDSSGHLATLNTAGHAVGQTFQIFDDDEVFMPLDFKLPLSSGVTLITDAVKAKFIPAYIELTTDVVNTTRILPFKLNQTAPYPDPPGIADSQPYWAHRVIAAYQPALSFDGDPNSEEWTWGATDTGHVDSLIYMETIREEKKQGLGTALDTDVQTAMRRIRNAVVAHEIGHVLGGVPDAQTDHQEEGLMTKGVVDHGEEATFLPKTIFRFRKVIKCLTN